MVKIEKDYVDEVERAVRKCRGRYLQMYRQEEPVPAPLEEEKTAICA